MVAFFDLAQFVILDCAIEPLPTVAISLLAPNRSVVENRVMSSTNHDVAAPFTAPPGLSEMIIRSPMSYGLRSELQGVRRIRGSIWLSFNLLTCDQQ